jgi:5-methylcytosine-specific restriction endonuclease McrA
MPTRIPTHTPPRLRSAQRADAERPNAYQRGYTDRRHQAWRIAVLTRDAWQCRSCGRVCSDKREAHADHVSPVVPGTDHCRDGRSRYDIEAGQCLCVSCHQRKTNDEMRNN